MEEIIGNNAHERVKTLCENYIAEVDSIFDQIWFIRSASETSIDVATDMLENSQKLKSIIQKYNFETILSVKEIESNNCVIEKLIKEIERRERKINSHEYNLDDLDEQGKLKNLLAFANTFKNDSKTNIFRQAFIVMLSIFDATLQDLMRELIVADFFNFMHSVNEQKRYNVRELADQGDLYGIIKLISDDYLTGKYARDLIIQLYTYCPKLFEINENKQEDAFSAILEILSRRNVHLHKMGVTDHKYFEQAKNNPYSLKQDQYAVIDLSYLNKSSNYLNNFVFNLYQHIDDLLRS